MTHDVAEKRPRTGPPQFEKILGGLSEFVDELNNLIDETYGHVTDGFRDVSARLDRIEKLLKDLAPIEGEEATHGVHACARNEVTNAE